MIVVVLKRLLILSALMLIPVIAFSQEQEIVDDSEPELFNNDKPSAFEVPEQYKKENNGFLDLLFGGSEEGGKAMEDALKTSPVEGVEEEVEVVEEPENGDFQGVAALAIIDKTIGKKYSASVKVGSEYAVKKISVKPLSCWKSSDKTLVNESRALIDVKEVSADGRQKRIFYGWILASNPSASLLEHEEYDIILLNCKNN